MMDNLDVNALFAIPGGENFQDVTKLFSDAARDLEPGGLVFAEGFSLQDAMSVLEIGEPRLDTGITLQEERRPPFNPLVQLLPEEVCWILDRSFACEMEWHAGHTLSQTVFTLLYVHDLATLNPEFIPHGSVRNDRSRPPELITMVLRSAIFGLLKCCDIAWRELSKDNVQDCEDWQSEKCEVSLLEGVPVKHVLSKIEEACAWLRSCSTVTIPCRDGLLARMLLRRALLELMDCDLYKDPRRYQASLNSSVHQLSIIRSLPYPHLLPGSPASYAFDPYIARRLNTFGPLRTHELPAQEKVWDVLEGFLDDSDELRLMCNTTSIATWEIAGYLRAWSTQSRQKLPYIRSCTQSNFYPGVLVLNQFPLAWIVERFFLEILNMSYEAFQRIIRMRWRGSGAPPLVSLERLIRRLVIAHIKSLYQNPPRRRRSLMKSLIDWHALHDSLLTLVSQLAPLHDGTDDMISRVPDAALLWRLSIIREVVFSGFQLELYTMEEKAFAYWYAVQIIEEHLFCLDSLVSIVPEETTTYSELMFQHQLLTALQTMSLAMFSVTAKTTSFSSQRLRLNFLRRYKWAFKPAYDSSATTLVGQPVLAKFVAARQEILANDLFSPSDSFRQARTILQKLDVSRAGWAGRWSNDRINFTQNLADACGRLCALPATMRDLSVFDLSTLKWDPHDNPWFPYISLEKGDGSS